MSEAKNYGLASSSEQHTTIDPLYLANKPKNRAQDFFCRNFSVSWTQFSLKVAAFPFPFYLQSLKVAQQQVESFHRVPSKKFKSSRRKEAFRYQIHFAAQQSPTSHLFIAYKKLSLSSFDKH